MAASEVGGYPIKVQPVALLSMRAPEGYVLKKIPEDHQFSDAVGKLDLPGRDVSPGKIVADAYFEYINDLGISVRTGKLIALGLLRTVEFYGQGERYDEDQVRDTIRVVSGTSISQDDADLLVSKGFEVHSFKNIDGKGDLFRRAQLVEFIAFHERLSGMNDLEAKKVPTRRIALADGPMTNAYLTVNPFVDPPFLLRNDSK